MTGEGATAADEPSIAELSAPFPLDAAMGRTTTCDVEAIGIADDELVFYLIERGNMPKTPLAAVVAAT
ncbi:MAG: hypothetical protein LW820_03255 [Acidibacter sp.]|nr:hypothetical protein [Acidibacter sp.]